MTDDSTTTEARPAAAPTLRVIHPDAIYKPAEIAEILDIGVNTLTQWRYKGQGPSFTKAGGHVRYLGHDVRAWLEARRQSSTRAAAVTR